jgi:hypothetical protein
LKVGLINHGDIFKTIPHQLPALLDGVDEGGERLAYPSLGRDNTRVSVLEGGNLSLACIGRGHPAPETM